MRLLLAASCYIVYSFVNMLLFFRLGPLLPETLDVKSIPVSQIRAITINLSGRGKYINLEHFRSNNFFGTAMNVARKNQSGI